MKKSLAITLLAFILVSCASPPKRLSIEESRLLSTEFEAAKRYDNLLAVLEEELGALNRERKNSQEVKGNKAYAGDLEGEFFILGDIAEIYTLGLVDFQKAFEANEKALAVYNEIKRIGLQNLPDSPYFNPRRRLYYYFYPNDDPASLVDPAAPSTKQTVGMEGPANQILSPQGHALYFSPFSKRYLGFVRQMDLERAKAKIDARFAVLDERLGRRSPTPSQSEFAPAIAEGIPFAQDFTIVREALEKTGIYNPYYLNFYLAGKAWEFRNEWGQEAYTHVVYFGGRALEHAGAGRLPDDYESLAFLHYWVGVGELKQGKLREGIEQAEQLVNAIDLNDRALNEQAKLFAEKISSLKTQRTVVAGLGLILALAAVAGGSVAAAQAANQAATGLARVAPDLFRFALEIGLPAAGALLASPGILETLSRYRSAYAIKLNRLLDQNEQLEYFYELGRAYEQLGATEKAVEHYREAIAIIEHQRATIGAESQRISFLEDREGPYKRIVPLLIRLGRPQDALGFVERARSRAFIDLLGSGELVLATTEETEAYRQLVRRQSEIDAVLSQRAVGVAQVQYLLTREAPDLKAGGRDPGLELRSLATVTTVTPAELLQLVGREAALVEYFLGDSDLAVFLVQDGQIEAMLLPVERDQLFRRLKAFRDQIEQGWLPSELGGSNGGQRVFNELALSQELYATLVAPIANKVTKTRLYLVPHGPLHYIPFQALHDGERFLLERFTVSYLPSATVLKFLKEKQGKPPGGAGPFVLANPDLGDPQYDLPSAEREATLIRDSYPAAQVYARREATKERATALAGDFGLLHFATHGSFSVENPLDSSIALAKGGGSDGRLTAREIFALRLQASLVVLSACNTGLSRVSTGDELIGLSRAFLTAGSSNLVASLWEVADDSTALLMGEFYKNLKTMPKAEALRQAQLTLMRAELPPSGLRRRTPARPGETELPLKTASPYFWAPFILIGAGE
jgi:CHAT domain-containing protein/tetratricopeptide (TPR) repeat protein